MKVSIITVTFNSSKYLETAIKSVISQSYQDIEYLIIDGGSNDDTLEIIKKYNSKISKWISEPDAGMYDAINKGIRLASGKIIGILNSDDFYSNNHIIEDVVNYFNSSSVDAVFGNVRFVSAYDMSKTVRYVSGKSFQPKIVKWGFMPPHPSIFVRTDIFNVFGYYKTNYHIASDYEMVVRLFYVGKISYSYINLDMVIMRLGGISTKSIFSNYLIIKESLRACKENGVYTNTFMQLMKYVVKIFEFINK